VCCLLYYSSNCLSIKRIRDKNRLSTKSVFTLSDRWCTPLEVVSAMCLSINSNLLDVNTDTQFYRVQENPDRLSIDQNSFMLYFNANKSKQFLCRHNIWQKVPSMFVTQLSSNAGISIWRIVCVSTHCCFIGDTFRQSHSALRLAWWFLSRLQRKSAPYTNVLH